MTVLELGHYLAAKRQKVHAIQFTMDWGPVLWQKAGRHGTQWCLRMLPIGGLSFYRNDFQRLAIYALFIFMAVLASAEVASLYELVLWIWLVRNWSRFG